MLLLIEFVCFGLLFLVIFFGDFVDDFLILWTQWAYTVKLLAKALLIMSEHVHNCGENNVAAAI